MENHIQNSKNVLQNAHIDAKGNVIVGDNIVINLKEAAQYIALEKAIEKLNQRFKKTQAKIEKYPDDEDFVSDLQQINKELNERQEELATLKTQVIELAKTFERIDLDTERLQKAKFHFDKGEFKEARAVLDAELMTKELDSLLSKKKRLKTEVTKNDKNLSDKAHEFLILAQLTAIDFNTPNRFEKTIGYFELSLKASKTRDNTFFYAIFLHEHNRLSEALILYEDILKLIKGESSSLFKIKLTNNIGILYLSFHKMNEARKIFTENITLLNSNEKFDRKNKTYELVRAYRSYGILLKQLDNNDEAIKILESAIKINEIHIETRQEVITHVELLNSYADILRNSNQINQALDIYHEALDLLNTIENPSLDLVSTSIGIAQNIAIIYLEKKDLEIAEKYFLLSTEQRRILYLINPYKHGENLISVLTAFGNLYSKKSNYKKAIELYDESISIANNITDSSNDLSDLNLVTPLLNKGNTLEAMDKLFESKKNLIHALKILEKCIINKGLITKQREFNTILNNIAVLSSKFNLKAINLAKNGKYYKSKNHLHNAMNIDKLLMKHNSSRYQGYYIKTLTNMANLQSFYFNRYDESKKLILKIIPLMIDASEEEQTEIFVAIHRIGIKSGVDVYALIQEEYKNRLEENEIQLQQISTKLKKEKKEARFLKVQLIKDMVLTFFNLKK